MIATRPEKLPGIRTDPPASVPMAALPIPAASAAADPPLDPPGVTERSHGLRVMPLSGLSLTPFQPNSGMVVLPMTIAPASRARATAGESSESGVSGSDSFEPLSVVQPVASSASFTVIGTPSSGPAGVPCAQRRSAARAAAIALSSSSRWQNALRSLSWRSMRR